MPISACLPLYYPLPLQIPSLILTGFLKLFCLLSGNHIQSSAKSPTLNIYPQLLLYFLVLLLFFFNFYFIFCTSGLPLSFLNLNWLSPIAFSDGNHLFLSFFFFFGLSHSSYHQTWDQAIFLVTTRLFTCPLP